MAIPWYLEQSRKTTGLPRACGPRNDSGDRWLVLLYYTEVIETGRQFWRIGRASAARPYDGMGSFSL